MLGIFGEEDPVVPLARAQELQATLIGRARNTEFYYYPGASHAFANSRLGRYHPEAAVDAWQKLTAFLKANLTGGQ